MTTNNEAFEKWRNDNQKTVLPSVYKDFHLNFGLLCWQAATAEEQKHSARMVKTVSLAADAREASLENIIREKDHEIAELKELLNDRQTDLNFEFNRAEKNERELNELKGELSEQLKIKKQMQSGVVQIVDAIAEYFGKRNPAVVKLLEQVKELR